MKTPRIIITTGAAHDAPQLTDAERRAIALAAMDADTASMAAALSLLTADDDWTRS